MKFLYRSCAAYLFVAAMAGLMPAWFPTSAAAEAAQSAVAETVLSRQRIRMNQRVFDRVWNDVRQHYYDPALNGLDWRAARATYRPQASAAANDRQLYAVLTEMLDALDDDHANVQTPATVARREALRSDAAIIGLTLTRQDDGRWRIERVRPNSPASEADIPLGWILDSINGEPWGPDAETLSGVTVSVVLEDEHGVDHARSITPRVMPPAEPFVAYWASPTVMVLQVSGFEPGLGAWMGAMLAGLPPGADVVLDLRSNGGGRLQEAQNVLSCFVPAGTPWAVRTARGGREAMMRVEPGCGDLTGPVDAGLVVLVNDGSRSAAELTPAVLREQGRATIMGEPTPGAVLIAQTARLPDGGQLTLSRANFVTAGGVRLEKVGVTPDVAVTHSLADRRAGRDPVLAAAVAVLGGVD
jgi:carboxyl-terminal processing protease